MSAPSMIGLPIRSVHSNGGAEICGEGCCDLPTGEDMDTTVTALKALADPVRLRIVAYLAQRGEAACICSLPEVFNVSQPTLSHHLKKLVNAGICERTMDGTSAYFSLTPDVLGQLSALFFDWNVTAGQMHALPVE